MKKATIKQGDKALFVRALPFGMPAREVAELAAKRGLVMSRAYINNIRSASAQRVRGGKAKHHSASTASTFKTLAIQIGVKRSKELLRETEALISAKAIWSVGR